MNEELLIITQDGESWNQIAGFSNYWISDLGRVYNCLRHRLNRVYKDDAGYVLSDLKRDDCVTKSKRIHRLVAEAFLPDWNPEWPWTVNHINGIKDDNRLCNLEMLTTQDNSRHYQTAECFRESRSKSRLAMSEKMKQKCADPQYASQMSERMKDVWKDPKMRGVYVDCLHKRQSDPEHRKQVSDKLKQLCSDPEYRQRMSERQKQNWDNPKYRQAIVSKNQDRMWVHNDQTERWIHSCELSAYLKQGYLEGRLPGSLRATTQGKVRIARGDESKFVTPSELNSYLCLGWRLGKAKRQKVQCIETGQIFSGVEECASAFGCTVDLIRARCKGTATNFRKLKEFNFRFYEGEDPFADMRGDK